MNYMRASYFSHSIQRMQTCIAVLGEVLGVAW